MELKSRLPHFTAKHVTNEASHLAFQVLLGRGGLAAFDCAHPVQPAFQSCNDCPVGTQFYEAHFPTEEKHS